MKRFGFYLFVGGVCLAVGLTAPAKGFPWDEFQPQTLRAATSLDAKAAEKISVQDHRVILTGSGFECRTSVRFTGTTRPLSHDKQELIERWALLQKADRSFAQAYEEEFLFLEGSRKFWLAVQKQLAPLIRQKAAHKEAVEVYYFSGVGGLRTSDDWDWALLVAEFQIKK